MSNRPSLPPLPQAGQPVTPETHTHWGQRAAWVGVGCNGVLFAAKLLAGLATGSLSIAADAVNNLSDASSCVISLLGFKLGAKPADAGHPYGHGRYEYLAGLSVAVMILVIGVELLKSSVQRILHPASVLFGPTALAVLVLSIAAKFWLTRYYRRVGGAIHSQTLLAAAADSRNDVLSTACVLAGAVVGAATGWQLDGWLGLFVAGFILFSGFGLVRETLDPLLGRAPDEKEVADIRRTILSYPGVVGTHDLIIHDYGPGRQFASVHVEMRADGDPLKNHSVVDAIERDFLRSRGINLVVHLDPVADKSSAEGMLNDWLLQKIQAIHPALTVHDLRVLPAGEPGGPALEFDIAAPRLLPMENDALKAAAARAVQERFPQYACHITVDRDYAGIPGQDDE